MQNFDNKYHKVEFLTAGCQYFRYINVLIMFYVDNLLNTLDNLSARIVTNFVYTVTCILV